MGRKFWEEVVSFCRDALARRCWGRGFGADVLGRRFWGKGFGEEVLEGMGGEEVWGRRFCGMMFLGRRFWEESFLFVGMLWEGGFGADVLGRRFWGKGFGEEVLGGMGGEEVWGRRF